RVTAAPAPFPRIPPAPIRTFGPIRPIRGRASMPGSDGAAFRPENPRPWSSLLSDQRRSGSVPGFWRKVGQPGCPVRHSPKEWMTPCQITPCSSTPVPPAGPSSASPPAATATPAPQARGEAGHADSIHEVDGDLVGSDPNFYGVIPGSGHCSWRFNVAEEPGIVYSALDCSRPRGRTHALVGTNPATGCNDARVCEFLDKSSIDWD